MIEYTLEEAAAVLGKSTYTIRRWADNGKLRYTPAAGFREFMVSKNDVDALLDGKPGDEYVSVKEAGEMLGMSYEWVRRFSKKTERVKWLSNWYIPRDAIHQHNAAGYGTAEPDVEAKPDVEPTEPVEYLRPPATPRQIEHDMLMARIEDVGR